MLSFAKRIGRAALAVGLAGLFASAAGAAGDDKEAKADIKGWGLAAWNRNNPTPGVGSQYECSLDREVKQGGEASLHVRWTAPDPPPGKNGEGAYPISQAIRADAYRGKRVRLSGDLKTRDVRNHVGLWLRIDGPNRGDTFGFDQMDDRSVEGTTDWGRHEVVLDVPKEAAALVFGVIIEGAGEFWADDLALDVVDTSVSTTGAVEEPERRQPENLDFEAPAGPGSAIPGWQDGDEDMAALDRDERHGGRASATLRSAPGDLFKGLIQDVSAEDYRGKRVRLSGDLKTRDVADRAVLMMRVFSRSRRILANDSMIDRPVVGTTDWSRYDLVLDVPEEAAEIQFGFMQRGAGQTWADDLRLEIVDPDEVATTGKAPPAAMQESYEAHLAGLPEQPVNLGFED